MDRAFAYVSCSEEDSRVSLVPIMQICYGKLQDCVIMRISWHTLPMQQELPARRVSTKC